MLEEERCFDKRALPGIGMGLWAIAIALWLAITSLHIRLGGIPAGIWRWLG